MQFLKGSTLLYSVFVSIRFCCIKATVHTAPFSYKSGEKNLRFCAFTLICPITKPQRKTSVFVRSHYSVFVKLIVGYWSVFKNLRFCAFTLICPITKPQRKTSVFVRSHYSVFVKLIVGYWSVFKNLRFCAFTLIKCVFKNLRFFGYPLLTAFSKTSVFVAFLCGSV